jgi:hypothetical protein
VLKFLRRLFRAVERGKVDPSTDQPVGNVDPLQKLRALAEKQEPFGTGPHHELVALIEKSEDVEKGLNALSELALGKHALAESIIGFLASHKDMALDLQGRIVDEDERIVLNLWGITLCVMRGLAKVSNVNNEEKHAFLHQYHEFIYFMSRPEGEEARLSWAVAVHKISALSQTRYQEYYDAFGEMMRRQEAVNRDPSVHLMPGAPLMHAITKNLFGLESNSLLLAFEVQSLIMARLISFAKTFGTPKDWAIVRHLMGEAYRALGTGEQDS